MKKSFLVMMTLTAIFAVFAAEIKGKCVSVSDGDTITVQESSGAKFRIRLCAIDAPEKKQPFGEEAKVKLTELLLGKDVLVTFSAVDRYARIIGTVLVDGKDAAKEMLKAGLAWHYAFFDNDPENAALQKKAQEAKIGLWSQDDPEAPWIFRNKKKGKSFTSQKGEYG